MLPQQLLFNSITIDGQDVENGVHRHFQLIAVWRPEKMGSLKLLI